jgi:hypothetical protein
MSSLRVLFIGFDEIPQTKESEYFKGIRLRTHYPDFDKQKLVSTGHSTFRTSGKVSLTNVSYHFGPIETDLPGIADVPTLYDYHIVFISADALKFQWQSLFAKASEFQALTNAPFGGVVILPILDGRTYTPPVPISPTLKEANGDTVILNEKHWMYPVLKSSVKYVKWRAHANLPASSMPEESGKAVIATNLADNPIALDYPINRGRVVYLPYIEFPTITLETAFLRSILDRLISQTNFNEKATVPTWASKPVYAFKREKVITDEIGQLNAERETLNDTKSILWLDGLELTNAVARTLTALDISCEATEKEGRHDIEINETDLHAIAEVKGLSKYADVQDLRQLRDWQEEKMKEDDGIKGIFILNSFKDLEPSLRGAATMKFLQRETPFTKEADRIAMRNEFCLLTTDQLFAIFQKKLEQQYRKSDFLRSLKETKGAYLVKN